MKNATVIVLLLALISLVSWDIVLRMNDTEQKVVFPTKTAEDMHDYQSFHVKFWQIAQGHKAENYNATLTPAIAVAGLMATRAIIKGKGRANEALKEAWDTIDIVRSIHGDDGPETTFVYNRFFQTLQSGRSHGLPDIDRLLPFLEMAWKTADVPDRLGLLSVHGKKDSLCEYIANQIGMYALFSKHSFKEANLISCQEKLDQMKAIMSLPWLERLFETKENRIGTSDFESLTRQRDLAEARVQILSQNYQDAETLLDSTMYPDSLDVAAELRLPLYLGWHASDPTGGHEEAIHTWATRILANAEKRERETNSRSNKLDWRRVGDKAKDALSTIKQAD